MNPFEERKKRPPIFFGSNEYKQETGEKIQKRKKENARFHKMSNSTWYQVTIIGLINPVCIEHLP